MDLLIPIAVGTGCAAIAEDLWRARISNWTSGGAVAGGLWVHCAQHGWQGASTALLGAITGFGIFFLLYFSGGMGGGDVKLMAGFGSILGATPVLKAAFLAAILGAILAAAVWIVRHALGRSSSVDTVPYAPAISLGAWLVLFGTT